MAIVGFRKVYAVGAFDKAAVADLFTNIKAHMAAAGFKVLADTTTLGDYVRAGSPAGVANDDVPHWAFRHEDLGQNGKLHVHPIHGAGYDDPAARTSEYLIADTNLVGNPSPELKLWFAADGVAGWWWLYATAPNGTSATGVELRAACVGATSRRYASDTYQGLCTRYGVFEAWGYWLPAYITDDTGSAAGNRWCFTWSPFGIGWKFSGRRHAGSPLPRLAVPVFPVKDGGSACVLGEFNEVLAITDGYAQGGEVVPGWFAWVGSNTEQSYAVPAPVEFTQL